MEQTDGSPEFLPQADRASVSFPPSTPPSEDDTQSNMEHLKNIFQAAPVGLCFVDLGFRYTVVNECFARMYDQPRGHFIGRTVREALPAIADQIMAHLEKCLVTGSLVTVELTYKRSTPSGNLSDTSIYLRTAQPMHDAGGAIIGFSVALTDITERKRTEAALLESEENHRYAVDLNPHIPFTADAHGNILYLSPRFLSISGLTSEEANLEGWVNAIHPDHRTHVASAWQHSVAAGTPFDETYRLHCAGHIWRWVRGRAFPRRTLDGNIFRWYGTLEDIHERTLIGEALRNKTARLEEVSEQLAQRVREDHLTRLANRRHFDDALNNETRRARRSHQPLSLVMLDVDHFKRYNDTYGHPAGDKCLREVAQALKSALRRQGDLAARYGGEEFVILLPDTSEEGALQVARYATQAVRGLAIHHPASDTGFLTISAGVSSFDPENDLIRDDAAILLQAADQALYAAKSAGRDRTISAHELSRTGAHHIPSLASSNK